MLLLLSLYLLLHCIFLCFQFKLWFRSLFFTRIKVICKDNTIVGMEECFSWSLEEANIYQLALMMNQRPMWRAQSSSCLQLCWLHQIRPSSFYSYFFSKIQHSWGKINCFLKLALLHSLFKRNSAWLIPRIHIDHSSSSLTSQLRFQAPGFLLPWLFI